MHEKKWPVLQAPKATAIAALDERDGDKALMPREVIGGHGGEKEEPSPKTLAGCLLRLGVGLGWAWGDVPTPGASLARHEQLVRRPGRWA
jgi:hypothetical protein